MLSRESPYVRLAYALTGLRSYAKIEMKNEALHRQTVRPNYITHKNSRNNGDWAAIFVYSVSGWSTR